MAKTSTVIKVALPFALLVAGMGLCYTPAVNPMSNILAPAQAQAASNAQYADGIYEGTGKGIGGSVPVTVTISDGVISDVIIGDNSETPGIGTKAINIIPGRIVAANGTEGVDAISGATVTSKAILIATDEALAQASTGIESTADNNSEATTDSTDRPDHLGKQHFGRFAITIPDSAECQQYDSEVDSDGLLSTNALYGLPDLTISVYYTEMLTSPWSVFPDPDDLASEYLDQLYCETGYEALEDGAMSYQGDGKFLGSYKTTTSKGIEIGCLITVGLDAGGNLIAVMGIPFSDDGTDLYSDIVDSLTGAAQPDTVSSTSSSTSVQSSSRPSSTSYTPTTAEKNALDAALKYLACMPFSRDGLINQLEYEGYSASDAKYAVDHCNADWNEQALLKAKKYLECTSFSQSGLIDQLEYEGFTSSEAEYAVKRCGADWNEQAVLKARKYLEYSSFSRSELIGQLEYEGFTRSQATNAATAVGL